MKRQWVAAAGGALDDRAAVRRSRCERPRRQRSEVRLVNSTRPTESALRPGAAGSDSGLIEHVAPIIDAIFALLAFWLLATPLVVGLVAPDSPASDPQGRALPCASADGCPRPAASWLAAAGGGRRLSARTISALRQALITAHRELTKPMLGFGNDSVLVGRDGRMFYLGEETVRQSAGLLVRDREGGRRDGYARAHERRASGAGNPLPGRVAARTARPSTRTTCRIGRKTRASRPSTTCLLAKLAAKGVTAVDLRPAVRKARSRRARSSICTIRIGRPEARSPPLTPSSRRTVTRTGGSIRPRRSGPCDPRKGGDLARMLGVRRHRFRGYARI